jgi:hypothetical protein
MHAKPRYSALAEDDDSQASTEELDLREKVSGNYSRVRRGIILHWLIHVITLLCLAIALFFQIAEPSLARCWKLYNYYCKKDG